jgi:hypothetical protein
MLRLNWLDAACVAVLATFKFGALKRNGRSHECTGLCLCSLYMAMSTGMTRKPSGGRLHELLV